MKTIARALLFSAVAVTAAGAVSGQAARPAAPTTLSGDLIRAVNETEQKLTALGQALSAEQYAWRPSAGVRSSGEVLMHVAADNYLLPAFIGVAAPAATKITTDFATAQAFEKQQLDKAATMAQLKASFDHLEAAIAGISEQRMNEKIQVFGQEFTVRGFLVVTTTHLSEHLGQMIAYARSNNVTPPWSR